jgi:hypothetical protein
MGKARVLRVRRPAQNRYSAIRLGAVGVAAVPRVAAATLERHVAESADPHDEGPPKPSAGRPSASLAAPVPAPGAAFAPVPTSRSAARSGLEQTARGQGRCVNFVTLTTVDLAGNAEQIGVSVDELAFSGGPDTRDS